MHTSEQGATAEGQPLTHIPPFPGHYWLAQRGWYAGIMLSDDKAGAWHVIVPDAPECQLPDSAWGEYGELIKGADRRRDGLANTMVMLAANNALACAIRALPGSCYLPSLAEAQLACATLHEQFKDGYHWTSTQIGRYGAWVQDFEGGLSDGYSKGLTRRVRPFRRLFIESFGNSGSASAS